MAIKLIKKEWNPCLCTCQQSFILDSAEEVADLPQCCPGSTAMVVAKDGGIYMVNASGEWEEL